MATGDKTHFTQEDRVKTQPQNDWDIVSPSSI
jgi:hypothetical protein